MSRRVENAEGTKRAELLTDQATVAHRQNVSVAALVLRWSNKQQEMWVVLTRNGFRFVYRIS